MCCDPRSSWLLLAACDKTLAVCDLVASLLDPRADPTAAAAASSREVGAKTSEMESLRRSIAVASSRRASTLSKSQRGAGAGGGIGRASLAEPSNSRTKYSPRSLLVLFKAAVEHNPEISQSVARSRFDLAEELEAQEAWPRVVDRMLGYLEGHNFDADESSCIRILELLRSAILRERFDAAGRRVAPGAADYDAMLDRLNAKQRCLDAQGVTLRALHAVATHPVPQEGGLADHAIELLLELLRAGPPEVRDTIYRYLCAQDKDLRVLHHLKARFQASLAFLADRQLEVATGFAPLTQAQRVLVADALQSLEIVAVLCARHAGLQNLLREQPMHSGDVNVVECVLEVLSTLGLSQAGLARMEDLEVDLLRAAMETASALVLGPCAANQTLVVATPGVLNAVEKTIQGRFHERVAPARQLAAKAAVAALVAAVLAGREPGGGLERELRRDLHLRSFARFHAQVIPVLAPAARSAGGGSTTAVAAGAAGAARLSAVQALTALVGISRTLDSHGEDVTGLQPTCSAEKLRPSEAAALDPTVVVGCIEVSMARVCRWG